MAVARLLDKLRPLNYHLKLMIGDDKNSFRASETITFELNEASDSVTLHAAGLAITTAQIGQLDGSVRLDEDAQTVSISWPQTLQAGTHEMDLEFEGPIQDSLHGFYRAVYTEDSQQHWFLMTQFEAIHAREAFVCIDEPAAKAVFVLELECAHEPGLKVLANTPVVSDTTVEGRRHVSFAPTPKMSTYLLAWVMSRLTEVTTTSSNGVDIGIYATPGHAGSLDYAREVTPRILDHYEAYFDAPYPLPKLDLVACPNFAAGAMENWGLVTYRETDLLVDALHTSLPNKQRVTEVIAHELAHQWFGNLVTMTWWEDLWLNESFASWAETMTVDALEPDWHWWTEYLAGLGAYARELDGLVNTHPILVEVPDPKGLDEIFDAISYFKGQGLIRMLEAYLGADVFRKGLRQYIKKNAYANATTSDLWQALSDAAGIDVATLMKTWTTVPGYPLVRYDGGTIKVERFIASAREAKNRPARQKSSDWHIPWSAIVATGSGRQSETPQLVLTNSETDMPPALSKASWLKPNPGEKGFWRSLYDEDMLARLLPALEKRVLPEADRYGVISDMWATVAAGHTNSAVALEMVSRLHNERDYFALVALLNGFSDLLTIVEDEPVRDQLKAFGRWLVSDHVDRLGWQAQASDSHFDVLLRAAILTAAIRFDVPGMSEEARNLFEAYADGKELDANIRFAVLYGTARTGGVREYERMLALYLHETAPQARQAQLVSLGRFQDPMLATRTLDWALSDDVKSQDLVYGLSGVWRTRKHRQLAWEHLKKHWGELVKRFGEGGHMLDRFPEFAGTAFATHAQADAVEVFFAQHRHIVVDRPAAQAVETIRLKADWYERDAKAISDFAATWNSKQTSRSENT